ncbi:MAG: hypothetical protein U9Q33_10065, partial [Campylobacterota bacterium]|nr:hypothetical protein [Campylobacterota bacterium]
MRRILKNSLFYIYLGVLFFGYIIADSLNKLDVYIGIAVGIMLALIELVISSNKIDKLDQKNIELAKAKNELDNYKKMGVIRILENKDDTSDY